MLLNIYIISQYTTFIILNFNEWIFIFLIVYKFYQILCFVFKSYLKFKLYENKLIILFYFILF
jgi:hypothetical protein